MKSFRFCVAALFAVPSLALANPQDLCLTDFIQTLQLTELQLQAPLAVRLDGKTLPGSNIAQAGNLCPLTLILTPAGNAIEITAAGPFHRRGQKLVANIEACNTQSGNTLTAANEDTFLKIQKLSSGQVAFQYRQRGPSVACTGQFKVVE